MNQQQVSLWIRDIDSKEWERREEQYHPNNKSTAQIYENYKRTSWYMFRRNDKRVCTSSTKDLIFEAVSFFNCFFLTDRSSSAIPMKNLTFWTQKDAKND